MSDFYLAIPGILRNEGGFVDDFSDKGGATNFGISLNFLKTISPKASIEDIKNLTEESAIKIYRDFFWIPSGYQKIKNQKIANYAFDCSVNHGMKQANKFIQRAIMAVDHQPSAIEDDGIFGAMTLSKVNSPLIDNLSLFCCMQAIRAEFFRYLVYKDKSQQKFLNGWLRRAYQNL